MRRRARGREGEGIICPKNHARAKKTGEEKREVENMNISPILDPNSEKYFGEIEGALCTVLIFSKRHVYLVRVWFPVHWSVHHLTAAAARIRIRTPRGILHQSLVERLDSADEREAPTVGWQREDE